MHNNVLPRKQLHVVLGRCHWCVVYCKVQLQPHMFCTNVNKHLLSSPQVKGHQAWCSALCFSDFSVCPGGLSLVTREDLLCSFVQLHNIPHSQPVNSAAQSCLTLWTSIKCDLTLIFLYRTLITYDILNPFTVDGCLGNDNPIFQV